MGRKLLAMNNIFDNGQQEKRMFSVEFKMESTIHGKEFLCHGWI